VGCGIEVLPTFPPGTPWCGKLGKPRRQHRGGQGHRGFSDLSTPAAGTQKEMREDAPAGSASLGHRLHAPASSGSRTVPRVSAQAPIRSVRRAPLRCPAPAQTAARGALSSRLPQPVAARLRWARSRKRKSKRPAICTNSAQIRTRKAPQKHTGVRRTPSANPHKH
jgi:hypothetical protein